MEHWWSRMVRHRMRHLANIRLGQEIAQQRTVLPGCWCNRGDSRARNRTSSTVHARRAMGHQGSRLIARHAQRLVLVGTGQQAACSAGLQVLGSAGRLVLSKVPGMFGRVIRGVCESRRSVHRIDRVSRAHLPSCPHAEFANGHALLLRTWHTHTLMPCGNGNAKPAGSET